MRSNMSELNSVERGNSKSDGLKKPKYVIKQTRHVHEASCRDKKAKAFDFVNHNIIREQFLS